MFDFLSKKQKKILLISVLGTSLEFYDFTLYGVFAQQISQAFFPSSDPFVALLQTFAVFGAGFLMRPLGGAVFGYIGDKYGRRVALTSSILIMGIPILITGILPPFAKIGVIAPLVLLLCRLLQGFSTGGEFNGAAIYVLEHTKEMKPGLIGALIATCGGLGAIVAMGIDDVLTYFNVAESGWRAAFIFGAGISFIGVYLRNKLDESEEYLSAQKEKKGSFKDLRQHKASIFSGVTMGLMDGAFAYTLVGFLTIYTTHFLKLPLQQAALYSTFGLGVYIFATPLMGHLFDKIKKFLPLMVFGILIAVPIAFALIIEKSVASLLLGNLLFALCFSAISGSQHAYLQKLFPVQVRYLGISGSFNLGIMMGGFTPMIFMYFTEKTQSPFFPAIILMCLVGFFALSLAALRYQKNGKILTKE